MGVGSFFSKIAPWTAAAVQFVPGFGPVAAQAITTIAGKNGVKVPSNIQPTVDSISQAVASFTGNPQALAELKQQEEQYQLQLQQMGFQHIDELQQLEDADRANARAREVAVKDRTPAILAFVVTGGFFTTLWFVFVRGVPSPVHDLAMTMVGILGTAWTGVIAYYFGSSKGSDDKSAALVDIAKQ